MNDQVGNDDLTDAAVYMATLENDLKERVQFSESPLGRAIERHRENQSDLLEKLSSDMREINDRLADIAKFQRDIRLLIAVLAGIAVGALFRSYGVF